MICTIGNTKGGVGKTTIAINLVIGLAMQGLDILLVDGDEQGTAMAFTELRSDALGGLPGYTAVALHGSTIRTQVRQLASRYAHVVIDVGGRDSGSLRAALLVSHLVVIPAAPRSFDLWGVDQTADLIREAREFNADLRAVAILNGADPSGLDNLVAAGVLGEVAGVEIAPVRLVRRKAFPNAAAAGKGILEYVDRSNNESAAKARADFAALLNFLYPKGSSL